MPSMNRMGERATPRRKSMPKTKMQKRKPMKKGGALKPVDKNKNPGLAKLPTKVRNKMGFMKKGGRVTKAKMKMKKKK